MYTYMCMYIYIYIYVLYTLVYVFVDIMCTILIGRVGGRDIVFIQCVILHDITY